MSYLTLTKGIPDFSKAVISLWFRVPQESIDKALAADQFADVLARTIPLLTFGDGPTIIDWEPNSADVGIAMNFPQAGCPPVGSVIGYDNAGNFPISPCYIGVDCSGPKPILTFNLQTAEFAIHNDTNHSVRRMEVYGLLTIPPPSVGDPNIPGNSWNDLGFPFVGFAAAFVDLSASGISRPEYFVVRTQHEIEPDRWHHVLLSFDLSPGCSTHQREDVDEPGTIADATSAYCKLWYAIDDVNYDGSDNMGPFAVDGGDKNGILTDNAWHVANSFHRLVSNTVFPTGTCSFSSAAIPSSDHEMGLPASAKYVDSIYRVELAELQVFTGVTLDTAIEKNRRVFVDKDGTPVDPTGTDEKPAPAVNLLGKQPAVLLHGSSNWKQGANTGTVGIRIETDGTVTVLPAGQFQPTGGIEQYTPDPALEESTA